MCKVIFENQLLYGWIGAIEINNVYLFQLSDALRHTADGGDCSEGLSMHGAEVSPATGGEEGSDATFLQQGT